ncbi:MAG: ABC transporter ATP-binding protein [Candidatus Paceibacterota bacterium]
MLIEVSNVSKSFQTGEVVTDVLHDISFEIDKKEFVSIRGPSGSGKSTLLHILGFLAMPSSGNYRFQGKEFSEYSEEEIADIRNKELGFIFQSFNLLGRSTVFENVRLPLLYSTRPEKEWDERIRQAIKRVGLEHRSDYQTLKLSGGEKQRVAIARALVNKPNLILADEPTGNLDSVSGGEVMNTLKNLHEELGHTIVLITHDEHTASFAKREIQIEDGRVRSDEVLG